MLNKAIAATEGPQLLIDALDFNKITEGKFTSSAQFRNKCINAKNYLNKCANNIEWHIKNCNFFRFSGSVMSITGGIIVLGSVIAIPFTAGASSVVLAGEIAALGTAYGVTGTVMNVGSDIVKSCFEKDGG